MLSYPHTQPCLYNESTFCLLLGNFFFPVNFRIIFNILFPTQLIWLFLVLHTLPTSPTANYLCIFSTEEGRKESAALCFTMGCPFLPQAKNRAPGHSPLPFWLIWLKKKLLKQTFITSTVWLYHAKPHLAACLIIWRLKEAMTVLPVHLGCYEVRDGHTREQVRKKNNNMTVY